MYKQLLNLDTIRINFSASGMHTINIILGVVMFGVALGIKPGMFKDIFQSPKSFIVGLVSQIIVLPLVTFLLVVVLNKNITPMVAMGMILVASCPGGNISNFISSLGKANTELSVSLTATNTLLSVFITPFNFSFWGGLYTNFIDKHAANALQTLDINTMQMFETVFILLGIPLILGILTNKLIPGIAKALRKPMQYLSIVFFILMVILAFRQNFDLFIKYIFFIFIIVLIHNALALGSGFGISSLFKLPRKDRRTVTIETGIQNAGLGLVLLFNPKIFPPDIATGGMIFITAWWGIWHIISGLTIAGIFNLRKID